jgi:hypothetical protein
LPEIVKDDVLDLDINVRKSAVVPVREDDIVLAFLLDHGTLHVAVQKVEGIRLVTLNGETIPAEVQLRPTGEVILVLHFLRPILEVAIVDRFGPANVVDTEIMGCMLARALWLSKVTAASARQTMTSARIVTFR